VGLLITPAQVSVLKLALSLHIYSPKLEMYSQMAVERGVCDISCPVVADVAGKLTCHVEEMKKLITQKQVKKFAFISRGTLFIFLWNHMYEHLSHFSLCYLYLLMVVLNGFW
jgi:hypothetical protein